MSDQYEIIDVLLRMNATGCNIECSQDRPEPVGKSRARLTHEMAGRRRTASPMLPISAPTDRPITLPHASAADNQNGRRRNMGITGGWQKAMLLYATVSVHPTIQEDGRGRHVSGLHARLDVVNCGG